MASRNGRLSSSVFSASASFETAQEAHNQPVRDAEIGLALDQRPRHFAAADDRREGHAAAGVALRIERRLRRGRRCAAWRGRDRPRSVLVEILLGHQRRQALIVDVEEFPQIVETIGVAQRIDRAVGQLRAVAARQTLNIISGSNVPSRWRCNSAFGMPRMKSVRSRIV